MPIDQPVPVTILTGFLGAGKTTLLNRLLNGDHGKQLAVLVNDFGAINIDSQLITQVETTQQRETISLSNGCICCTIRDDFVEAIWQILQGDTQPENIIPEHIIIEASGVSDPIDIALVLRNMPQIRIDSVLTLLDAENILDTAPEHRDLVLNQVAMADIVLINKVDLVDAAQIERITAYVRGITPASRIIKTINADVPLNIVMGGAGFSSATDDAMATQTSNRQAVHVHHAGDEAHDHHHDDSIAFKTWHWHSTEPVSYRALKRAIDDLPMAIYRAKGMFFLADMPDKQGVLHVVGKRATLTLEDKHWQGLTPRSQVVVIGRDAEAGDDGGIEADALQTLFDDTLAKNAPANDLQRLTDAALSWLRGKR